MNFNTTSYFTDRNFIVSLLLPVVLNSSAFCWRSELRDIHQVLYSFINRMHHCSSLTIDSVTTSFTIDRNLGCQIDNPADCITILHSMLEMQLDMSHQVVYNLYNSRNLYISYSFWYDLLHISIAASLLIIPTLRPAISGFSIREVTSGITVYSLVA
jgi:hypothetical protein